MLNIQKMFAFEGYAVPRFIPLVHNILGGRGEMTTIPAVCFDLYFAIFEQRIHCNRRTTTKYH